MQTPAHSPAADRNKAAILAQLQSIVSERGTALEIASGTGQHVVWFANAMPHWTWQPSDGDLRMLPDIAQRIAESHAANVLPPVRVDVMQQHWPLASWFDLIFCANMLHIAPWPACEGLMAGAARHLLPHGRLITYGPYLENDVPTAPSNLAFDESLRARDASWGIRRLDDVVGVAATHGLKLSQRHAMPANNLLLVFELHSRDDRA